MSEPSNDPSAGANAGPREIEPTPSFGSVFLSVAALLSGTAILLLGGGLYGTLLPIRATIEGFDPVTIAFIMAANYVGFVAGTRYCVGLIENVGHIRVYAALAAVASAATLAHVLIIDSVVWVCLRGIVGFCFAGLYMIVESWLGARSDNTTRGRVLSTYMGVNLGALAAGQMLLLLASSKSFELFTLVSILISLATLPIALSRAPAPAPSRTPRLPLRQLVSISPLGTVGCLVAGVATGAWWSLAPVVIFTVEGAEFDVVVFMIATILGGLVAQWPIGRLSDRFDRRTVLISVAAAACLASCWLAVFLAWSFPLVVAGGVVHGATLFCIYALSVAHANDRREGNGIVALSAGLLLVYGIGAISGSVAVGAAVQGLGPRGLFIFSAAVFLALALYGVRRMTVSTAPPAGEQAEFVAVAPRATPAAAELDPRGGPPAA